MFDHSFVWEYGISKILKKVVIDHQSPNESGKFRSTPEYPVSGEQSASSGWSNDFFMR